MEALKYSLDGAALSLSLMQKMSAVSIARVPDSLTLQPYPLFPFLCFLHWAHRGRSIQPHCKPCPAGAHFLHFAAHCVYIHRCTYVWMHVHMHLYIYMHIDPCM